MFQQFKVWRAWYRIVGGVCILIVGVLLYFLPKDAGITWYMPLPAFAAGAFLIWLGVVALREVKEYKGPSPRVEAVGAALERWIAANQFALSIGLLVAAGLFAIIPIVQAVINFQNP